MLIRDLIYLTLLSFPDNKDNTPPQTFICLKFHLFRQKKKSAPSKTDLYLEYL